MKRTEPVSEYDKLVLKDRFLGKEREENIYVSLFMYFIVFLMSFLLIFVSFVSLCLVDGTSMIDTLQHKDNVLLIKNPIMFNYKDIVVFHEQYENLDLIKRVVAVEGETIKFLKNADGTVSLYKKGKNKTEFEIVKEKYIHEDMTEESFLRAGVTTKLNTEIVVGKGFLYVMGDNRNDSRDSRYFGQISKKIIKGTMFFKLEKNSLLEKFLKFIYSQEEKIQD